VDAISRFVTLLRFLSFIALLYLSLHVIFSRLIFRPGSKLLWFFSILTSPLVRPIERLAPRSSQERLRLVSLVVYAALWLALVFADHALRHRP
jgi:hypothetical protein